MALRHGSSVVEQFIIKAFRPGYGAPKCADRVRKLRRSGLSKSEIARRLNIAVIPQVIFEGGQCFRITVGEFC
jgi:hypothetical protein